MITVGSLFSGYGGLDLGVLAALGGGVVLWHVEFDEAPSRILEFHWPDTPNFGDVSKVDWEQVPRVYVMTGGFPCQDVSLAGARAGLKDGTRSGLWSEFARAIQVVRPRLVVIENVRGLLSAEAGFTDEEIGDLESASGDMGELQRSDRPVLRAIGAVLGDLATIGYDASWCGLRAADAGAPHGRFRVFILAYPEGFGWGMGDSYDVGEVAGEGDSSGNAGVDVADSEGDEGRVSDGDEVPVGFAGGESGSGVADSEGKRRGKGRTESAGVEGGSDGEFGGAEVVQHAGHGSGGSERGDERESDDGSGEPGTRVAADSAGSRRGEGKDTGAGRGDAGSRSRRAKSERRGGEPFAADSGGEAVGLRAGLRAGEPGGLGRGRSDDKGVQGSVADADGERGGEGGSGAEGSEESTVSDERRTPGSVADADGGGFEGGSEFDGEPVEGAADGDPCGGHVDGHSGTADEQDWGPYAGAIERWEAVTGRRAPAPTVADGRDGQHRLNPVFVEWMMGLPLGHVTAPGIGLTRNQQLKALGNGVVPQQAALAVSYLLRSTAEREVAA